MFVGCRNQAFMADDFIALVQIPQNACKVGLRLLGALRFECVAPN